MAVVSAVVFVTMSKATSSTGLHHLPMNHQLPTPDQDQTRSAPLDHFNFGLPHLNPANWKSQSEALLDTFFLDPRKSNEIPGPETRKHKNSFETNKNPNFHLYHRLYSFVEAFKTNHLQTKVSRKNTENSFLFLATLLLKNVLTSKYYKWKPQRLDRTPQLKTRLLWNRTKPPANDKHIRFKFQPNFDYREYSSVPPVAGCSTNFLTFAQMYVRALESKYTARET